MTDRVFRLLCGAILFFLIAPTLLIIPVSFSAGSEFPIATMIGGTISGASSSDSSIDRPRSRPRTRASDAAMPTITR